MTVTVQVELARGKSAVKNAEKSVVQDEGAVKSAVKSSPLAKVAVKVAVKRTSPQLREKVIDKCAELYAWLNEDRSRTILQAIEELGYSDRSLTNYLEILRDAGALEHEGPRNGGEWVFMI